MTPRRRGASAIGAGLLAGIAIVASACVPPASEGTSPPAMPTPLGGERPAPPGLFASEGARNGCDVALPTSDGPVLINFGGGVGERYRPRCVAVEVGSRVVFQGDLALHPLTGGVVAGGEAYRDPSSDVPYVSAGLEAAFVPLRPGVYPFFCQVHWVLGMNGAVIVR